MQLIVGSHANCVIESLLFKKVQKCKRLSFREVCLSTNFLAIKMKIHLQSMNAKGWYCLSFDDFEC